MARPGPVEIGKPILNVRGLFTPSLWNVSHGSDLG